MSDSDDSNDDEMPSAPFWMTTFSDMVTLLLTFFVLIVSMSEIEIQKFKEALSFFPGNTGALQHESVVPSVKEPDSSPRFRSREEARRYEEFLRYLKENHLEDKVRVDLTPDGLHVVIVDSVMFHSGEAILIEPSRTILRLVAGILDDDVQSVIVEGHTDNRPINTFTYPSNWELSAARAASVVRFFLGEASALLPERYVATGYGEYRPAESNSTPEGRAHNRRVEILFSWKEWPQKPLR